MLMRFKTSTISNLVQYLGLGNNFRFDHTVSRLASDGCVIAK